MFLFHKSVEQYRQPKTFDQYCMYVCMYVLSNTLTLNVINLHTFLFYERVSPLLGIRPSNTCLDHL